MDLSAFKGPPESEELFPLLAVHERVEHGSVTRLAFGLAVVAVIPESDELAVSLQPPSILAEGQWTEVSSRSPWTVQIGNPVQWAWSAVNNQGYRDALMLGFDNPILPSAVLVAAASSIQVGVVAPAL